MPAVSKKQKTAMCMALAARKGDLEVSKLKGAALEIYNSDMTNKEIEDFTVLKEHVGITEYINSEMQGLSQYITEYLNESSKDEPKVGKIAVDEQGDEWYIEAVAKLKDGKAVKEIMSKYDTEDAIKDAFDDGLDENFDYLVGVHLKNNKEQLSAFFWGEGGLQYK
jgi:hypothetical protein